MAINVKRKPIKFYPDPTRVIARFFIPGKPDRTRSIVQRVLNLPEKEVNFMLNRVLRNFAKRHRNITRIFQNHFDNIKQAFEELDIDPETISSEKKLLIGSYFTSEFSIESAAFFNPSIVEDPYQGDLQQDEKRVIVSFRATGEGHISSLVFRNGIIDKNNDLTFEPPGELVDVPEIVKRHVYEKKSFLKKLEEMRVFKDVIGMVMDRLGDTFIYGELEAAIEETKQSIRLSHTKEKVLQAISWLANSHYEVTFSWDTEISERVLFPVSYSEVNGIEDARFVRFVDENDGVRYYATYTAYNGYTILPKLLETEDFHHFKVMPIHGIYAQNKGMSLFPKKINNKYAMISRCDGVNNFITFSDNINRWRHAKKLIEPEFPWEYVQIGNCGSPLETEKGWLVITHGIGPMREYSLGLTLLDLEDPTRVIARLKEPLLAPNNDEREGYVPNVIYSCGSIIHNNELIIPYGISDHASSFASVSLDELFDALLNN
jgi:predicted GH43/DUF377 family glycosyl hydrolase